MPFRRLVFSAALVPLLFCSMLLANALQMLSLALRPFSARAFREANRAITGAWFFFLAWIVETVGVRVKIEGDEIPYRENAVLIANHQAMVDIPALVFLARRAGRLGDLKWFVKDPIKWVPGIGWGMLFIDCIFVRRNWTADKDKVMSTFARLRDHQIPFWVISFLEGTRATPEKLERSRAFARKAGLPELKRVMLPRTKGFEATLEGLGPLVSAVYDATISYQGRAPTITELFLRVREITVHVKRYPLAKLPKEREALNAWTIERYREKDAYLAGRAERGLP
jgi:1-acyl-sn-glycerol-3-phosphate acyltransferase